MNNHHTVLGLLLVAGWLLCFGGPALASANAAEANGLYYVCADAGSSSAQATGSPNLRLGEKADIEIHDARVYAENNANTRFTVWLDTSEYPTDPVTGAMNRPVALRVGERVYPWAGGAGKTGVYTSLCFEIHSQTEAELAAKWLSVDCFERSCPGYRLLAQFVPAQAEFKAGGPMLVKFELKNLDNRIVSFRRGGQQRGARDSQFGFVAMLGGKVVPDTGNAYNHGGLFTIVDLKPGQTTTDQIDLRKWFNLDQPGTYFIHGFYQTDFYNEAPDKERASPWHVMWRDYASADFEVVVK